MEQNSFHDVIWIYKRNAISFRYHEDTLIYFVSLLEELYYWIMGEKYTIDEVGPPDRDLGGNTIVSSTRGKYR